LNETLNRLVTALTSIDESQARVIKPSSLTI